MRIDVSNFKGEAPRIAPRLLPNDMGQNSQNARLLDGNLETWQPFGYPQASTGYPNFAGTTFPGVVSIYYMNDQVWLTWFGSQSSAPLGALRQIFEVAMSAPTWPTNIYGSSPQDSPVILSVSPTVDVIDRNYQSTTFAGSGGDGNVYHYSPVTGALLSTTLQSAAPVPYQNWIFYTNRFGYSIRSDGSTYGPARIVTATTDGNNIYVKPQDTLGSITAFVSNSSASWPNSTFIYDFGNLLFNTSGFSGSDQVWGAFPCADFKHVIAIIATGGTVSKWAILNCLHGSEAVVQHGTILDLASQQLIISPISFTGNSSSIAQNNPAGSAFGTRPMGCLQSDLQTLWTVFFNADGPGIIHAGIIVLTVNQATLDLKIALGVTGGTGMTTYGTPAFPASNASQSASGTAAAIWADGGICAILCAQELTVWTILNSGSFTQGAALEVDVAKEAIAGDVSWRTIYCGTDAPRFTDLGLSTGLVDGSGHPITGSSTLGTGAAPYPIYSRKLGVPNPTLAPSAALVPAAAGSNAVSYPDTFDAPVNWILAPNTANTGSAFVVVGGNPGAYMQIQSIGAHEAISYKNFAIDPTQNFTVALDLSYLRQSNAHLQPSFMDFFVAMDATVSGSVVRIENKATGITLHFASVSNGVIGADIGTYNIASGSIPNWHTDSDTTYSGFITNVQWAHVVLSVVPVIGASTNCTITLTVSVGGVQQWTQAQTGMPNAGTYQGVGCSDPVESYPDWIILKVDNFTVSGTGPAAASSNLEATTYVYTIVNDLGEESGPSPVLLNVDGSDTITRPIGQAVQVTLPGTLALSGVDQTYFQAGTYTYPASMNLYRAVTGSAGTAFLFVANVAFSGSSATTYTDQAADQALSQAIQSTLWDPPPTTMLGIRALPNGIYAGFTGNILCLSAQGIPHAWPIAYQLAFDFPIVGIENVDTTIIVATSNYPYLAAGATPDAYSQTKATYPYACASKRSIQYLQNVGVVFATFEGLVAIAGPGQENLLTRQLFTKKEWLALNPSSMISAVNDDRYFCWFTTAAGAKGGFYLDLKEAGAGKVSLGWHAAVRYQDPLSDTLYIIPDSMPTAPSTQTQILAFDQPGGVATSALPYTWKSRQFYVEGPASFKAGRITAETYASIQLTLFADGRQYAQFQVPSQVEFVLPQPPGGLIDKYLEFQLSGTDSIDRIQIAEDFEELQA